MKQDRIDAPPLCSDCDRQCGLSSELDRIGYPSMGGFMYKIHVFGEEYDVPLETWRYKTPPTKPPIPEKYIVEKTTAWYELREWQLYQAAIAHEEKKVQEIAEFLDRAAEYILKNCTSKSLRLIAASQLGEDVA